MANLLNNMDFDRPEDRVTGALLYFLEHHQRFFKKFVTKIGLTTTLVKDVEFNLFTSLGKFRPDAEIILKDRMIVVIESKIDIQATREVQIIQYYKELGRKLRREHIKRGILLIISPFKMKLNGYREFGNKKIKIRLVNLLWLDIIKITDEILKVSNLSKPNNLLLKQFREFLIKKSYSLSKDEIKLFSLLEEREIGILTRESLLKLYDGNKRKVDNLLSNLTKKGRLKQLARTKYLVIPIKAPYQVWGKNEFIIADALMEGGNYYIGYNNMFNFYGFIQQVPQTIFVLNAKYSKAKIIDSTKYKFIKVAPNKLYGLTSLRIDGAKVKISNKERTLVDLVYYYKPIGSIKQALRVVNEQIRRIDLNKFIRYAVKFPNLATKKRIGYFLEIKGIEEKRLQPLLRSIRRSRSLATLYESRFRKGKINKKWGLIINA